MPIDIPRAEAHLNALLPRYGIPSAAVGVLHDGEVTAFAAGVTDVETGTSATSETVYQCGSMTKTWTALAFMQLVDEGGADLDEPVRAQLPGFAVADPEATARITPRHLLHHTHGIAESFGDPGEDDDVYARMTAAMSDAPQMFPPGSTHGYSAALGYALLARILEVHDGERWDEVMRRRLLTPLGLVDTHTRPEDVDPARTATGHLIRSLEEGPFRTPVDHLPRAFGPGGNITSTVREVLAMAHVVVSGGLAPGGDRVVSAEAVREMTGSRVPVPDPYLIGPQWALGLVVCDWDGRTVYASDGSTIGQNARLRVFPDSGTAVTVLTNGGPREPFHREVCDEILGQLSMPAAPGPPVPRKSRPVDPSRYTGVYRNLGTRYEVSAEGGDLHLTLELDPMQAAVMGRPPRIRYDMLPISGTHFLMPPTHPLEDPQTVALYDFTDGPARFLHTNARIHRRLD
ncbi:CubicO group peptidase (beta-lactamase class C family) [Stackebrandtia albiflava]|uniref:CubicO group peptidase (Beta-lactamase class C family) n=1 Tax=Stackebrandtia albiflava TaxID=406432 RepID=A0A562UQE6_9ACTN|nr:serine hydrolase domain-containing protein [Stackebrandtia albiflava]TWJ07840.1 CubicO group peptidase (beta-lactamase class C family) [Stackebrandtia albiflava]